MDANFAVQVDIGQNYRLQDYPDRRSGARLYNRMLSILLSALGNGKQMAMLRLFASYDSPSDFFFPVPTGLISPLCAARVTDGDMLESVARAITDRRITLRRLASSTLLSDQVFDSLRSRGLRKVARLLGDLETYVSGQETPPDPLDRLGKASTSLAIRLRGVGPARGRLRDVLNAHREMKSVQYRVGWTGAGGFAE
jgi:hypothetical protein